MAVKILALVSLIFYFLALVFGLMLFFNSDQRDLVTSGEAYGYSTIDLPNIDTLQGLMNQEAEIGELIDQLESELASKTDDLKTVEAELKELKTQYAALEAKMGMYQRGEDMAIDYLRDKQVDGSVATLGMLEEAELRFFVRYAMPFMRQNAEYTKNYDKFLSAINQNVDLAKRISTLKSQTK